MWTKKRKICEYIFYNILFFPKFFFYKNKIKNIENKGRDIEEEKDEEEEEIECMIIIIILQSIYE